MKRVLGLAAVAVLGLIAVLAAAFFTVGGAQVVTAMRGPQLPATSPASTPATDLSFFREAILANEHGPTARQFARFRAILDDAPTPSTNDDLGVLASRALTAFGNAHSTLVNPGLRRLPIRLHWTADALVVVKARPEHADLLGMRVVSIGGRAPEAMLADMPKLVGGGTASWRRYRSEYFFTAPAALSILGASGSVEGVELRFADPAGAESSVALAADAEAMPADAFWDFLDSFPENDSFETGGWRTLLTNAQTLPLYLQESDRIFLLRALPNQQAIYVRMNGSINDDSETAAAFTDRVLAQLGQTRARNVIVDFRYNRGGDFTLALPLVQRLSESVPADGKVYVIVGPNTFSAGLIAASQFKRYIPDRLTIVGEEVGDHLRFRGEGFMITLPASGIEAYVPTAWDDVANNCGWLAECWPTFKFLTRGVGSFEPDRVVANTWESYRTGRDLAVEAIFSDIAARQ